MARINLLPWREELRKQKKREFGVIAFSSVMLMGAVVLYAHLHIAGLIEHQESRNKYMQGQIKLVEAKIKEISELEKKRQQLIERMRVIEELQLNRPGVVHLFQELVLLVPEGLHLDTLKQAGDKIMVTGIAQSNARVSSFMRAIDDSPWFDKPQLDVIKSESKGVDRSRKFTLQFVQTNPAASDETGS